MPRCRNIFKMIFESMNQKQHYDMMMGIIKEDMVMRISYNKLWKMLIDKNMKKVIFRQAGISSASIAKLGKGDNITTDVLMKICEALNRHLDDIMETVDK